MLLLHASQIIQNSVIVRSADNWFPSGLVSLLLPVLRLDGSSTHKLKKTLSYSQLIEPYTDYYSP